MRTDIDYRLPEYRQLGFEKFYLFHCATNDRSPDIAVETWIADNLNFDFEKRCVMALFHGATYAGPCETMFSDKFPVMTSYVQPLIGFFEENKKRLLFSPDCKYRKMEFGKFLQSVGDSIKPYGTLGKLISSCFASDNKIKNYNDLQALCFDQWYSWGRMGHWCFSEALRAFVSAPIQTPTMEFKNGKSHRSGWAFCINRDDLTGDKISAKDVEYLENTAAEFLARFKKENPTTPNIDEFTLETACCNYKRQFKGSRYGGCYIDEQHTETMLMKKEWVEYDWLWNKYLEGRQAVIPASLLFENFKDDSKVAYLNDWNNALKDYGRIPRVESWYNNQPQRWTALSNMPFAKSNDIEGFFV